MGWIGRSSHLIFIEDVCQIELNKHKFFVRQKRRVEGPNKRNGK